MVVKSSYESLGLKYETLTGGAWVSHDIGVANYYTQETFNHFPLNTEVDDGGPWRMISHREYVVPGLFPGYYSDYGLRGQYVIGDRTGGSNPLTPSGYVSDFSLYASGTTAVARSLPTNPAFSLSTAIGEAREGMPALIGTQSWRARSLKAREAGGEYLNYQFGWLPLVSDIRSFASAVKNSHDIVQQYRKDSAAKIKRSYHFPNQSQTQVFDGSFFTSPSDWFVTGNEVQRKTTDLWFKGCFKYFLNLGNSTLDKFDRYHSYASRILGIDLTPEVLWNLAPWSWAADWFSNTGDVLHNISALGQDGLVMQYGYIMSHSQLITERSGTVVKFGSSWDPHPVYRRMVDETKQRLPATPYGFGVDLHSLTAKQAAILTALGLSRT